MSIETFQDFLLSHSGLALTEAFHGEVDFCSLSYEQLRTYSKNSGELLREKFGLKAGDVVSLVIPNSITYVVLFFGITTSRMCAAPLNWKYSKDEYLFYLKDAGSKLVIINETESDHSVLAAAAELNIPVAKFAFTPQKENCQLLLKTKDFELDVVTFSGSANETVKCEPSDPALFLHTSGTTSTPKGVPLIQSNLIASTINIATTYDMVKEDRSLLVMPLFHVHGLMCGLLASLYAGSSVVIPIGGTFSASTFWPLIVGQKCTWYTAVPTIHQILLARYDTEYPKENPPQLRFIRSCSSSLAPVVLERMETAFKVPVVEAYAMTEASHMMTSNMLPHKGKRKAGTVGMKTGKLKLSIRDVNNNEVPQGDIGEVCIQGPNVTLGYKNRPEANEEAFAGGWFHTGDQGKLDEDGYLALTGRIKELINRGGEKISPLEIDAVLLANKSVSEAVCFGAPDEMLGEIVHAAVILKSGAENQLTEEQIRAFCKERLAPFKVPKVFHITDDFPRTATGKIQRRHVATHFQNSVHLCTITSIS